MEKVSIGPDLLDIRLIEKLVSGPDNGGVCTFVGQVRKNSRGREVAYLEYEAYLPMALKMMINIADEAEARWYCQVAMVHRTGRIDLGEAAVVISVGSPHRSNAFEACRWCIDTLKETAPIWKKEVCTDGAYWIEGDVARESETGVIATT